MDTGQFAERDYLKGERGEEREEIFISDNQIPLFCDQSSSSSSSSTPSSPIPIAPRFIHQGKAFHYSLSHPLLIVLCVVCFAFSFGLQFLLNFLATDLHFVKWQAHVLSNCRPRTYNPGAPKPVLSYLMTIYEIDLIVITVFFLLLSAILSRPISHLIASSYPTSSKYPLPPPPLPPYNSATLTRLLASFFITFLFFFLSLPLVTLPLFSGYFLAFPVLTLPLGWFLLDPYLAPHLTPLETLALITYDKNFLYLFLFGATPIFFTYPYTYGLFGIGGFCSVVGMALWAVDLERDNAIQSYKGEKPNTVKLVLMGMFLVAVLVGGVYAADCV